MPGDPNSPLGSVFCALTVLLNADPIDAAPAPMTTPSIIIPSIPKTNGKSTTNQATP
tara:strand:+ start:389 stop:559 length:171 start_codon:yes stop_codon:yes gene_type:complete